jgi:hypothetical protein
MRGPWYLGPAHPLVFNEQSAYGLSAPFFQVRGDAAEFGDAERLAELQRRGMPRYVCNLLFTLPYGAARYRELLARCRAQWDAGLAALEAELDPAQPRVQLELDVVRTIAIHLTTLAYTLDFLSARDRLWQGALDHAGFRAILADLAGTLRAEIANAERALPILARDPRIGYGHCYGPVYDAAMVRDKLRQCRQVLEQELPSFSQGVRFHVWLDFRQETPP